MVTSPNKPSRSSSAIYSIDSSWVESPRRSSPVSAMPSSTKESGLLAWSCWGPLIGVSTRGCDDTDSPFSGGFSTAGANSVDCSHLLSTLISSVRSGEMKRICGEGQDDTGVGVVGPIWGELQTVET